MREAHASNKLPGFALEVCITAEFVTEAALRMLWEKSSRLDARVEFVDELLHSFSCAD
jgi:hypothetical protein